MTDIKAGARVKVEFEGVVTALSWEDECAVDGYLIPHDAKVTVLPPEEPTGVGAVVKVTYPEHVYYSDYIAVRCVDGTWYSPANVEEMWGNLFDAEGSVEILSPGIDLDTAS